MANQQNLITVKSELDLLTTEFFRAVSFESDETPPYENIHTLFVEAGLPIKNSATTPEISTVRQVLEPRQAMVAAGELTRFRELELSETTEIFGKVAHRFSAYAKSGTLKGVQFEARGMISTQFVLTPAGWKMSSMAWDDERSGLSLPDRYDPTKTVPRHNPALRLRVVAADRSCSLAFVVVAALAIIALGCAAPRAHPIGQTSPRLNELTALEIACAVAESDGLQLSDYNVSNIEYEVAGVWTVMFQRKGVSGPGNYFFVIVVDADGFATLHRGVW